MVALRCVAISSALGTVVSSDKIFVLANTIWHEYFSFFLLKRAYITEHAKFGVASAVSIVSISKFTALQELWFF